MHRKKYKLSTTFSYGGSSCYYSSVFVAKPWASSKHFRKLPECHTNDSHSNISDKRKRAQDQH